MVCPVCNESMLILEFQEIEIDFCSSCEGIWLDEGEMEAIIEFSETIDLSDFPQKVKSKRKCPRCFQRMVKGNFPGTDIEVDVCRRDGGIWLDKGEIQTIAGELCKPSTSNEICQFFAELFDESSDHNKET